VQWRRLASPDRYLLHLCATTAPPRSDVISIHGRRLRIGSRRGGNGRLRSEPSDTGRVVVRWDAALDIVSAPDESQVRGAAGDRAPGVLSTELGRHRPHCRLADYALHQLLCVWLFPFGLTTYLLVA